MSVLFSYHVIFTAVDFFSFNILIFVNFFDNLFISCNLIVNWIFAISFIKFHPYIFKKTFCLSEMSFDGFGALNWHLNFLWFGIIIFCFHLIINVVTEKIAIYWNIFDLSHSLRNSYAFIYHYLLPSLSKLAHKLFCNIAK